MSNVKGIDSLVKKFRELGGNVDDVLYKSLQTQGQLVKDDAKDLCPVDLGDLRQSIYRKTKRFKGKIVSTIYTNSDHGPYVEFGTGRKGEDSPSPPKYPGPLSYKQDKWLVNIPGVGPRYIEGMPAQPFLYPALKNNEERILENIKGDLEDAIRRVAKK